MLSEVEFSTAEKLYKKGFRSAHKPSDRFKDLTDYYKNLTGFAETNGNAIMHHRVSIYGPPCESCGKPYRTPKASFCVACGNQRQKENTIDQL